MSYLVVFVLLHLLSSFLWILILCQIYSWQRFSLNLWASSSQLIVSLAAQNLFSFMKSYLSTVGLNSLTNEVLFWEFFYVPVSCRILLMFSSSNFNVLGINLFRVRFFVWGNRYGSNLTFLHVCPCPCHSSHKACSCRKRKAAVESHLGMWELGSSPAELPARSQNERVNPINAPS